MGKMRNQVEEEKCYTVKGRTPHPVFRVTCLGFSYSI